MYVKAYHLLLEFKPTKSNYIAPIPVVQKSFKFSLEIKPIAKIRGWSSISRITSTGKDCCNYGDRIPLVKFNPNSYRLHIAFSLNGRGNGYWNSKSLKEGEYSKVVIKQVFMYAQKYRYSIHINGEEVHQTTNTKPQVFKDAKLYAGDAFFEPSNVLIRNLKFENLGEFYSSFVL